jgi:4-hydroxybenzoate polyprenyltransferase
MRHLLLGPSETANTGTAPGNLSLLRDAENRGGLLRGEVRSPLRGIIRLARPNQWVKNVFVLVPLLFSGQVANFAAIWNSAVALACFCLWSSAVYCLNDVLDAGADSRHPRKKSRPIPSGDVSPLVALILAAVLTATAFALAGSALPRQVVLVGALYLANSVAYCVLLKRRVIVDVLVIALGFVLRLVAGCWAIQVEPSSWILVCGFSLALLLGFGKRRLEVASSEQLKEYRPALQSYSAEKLNLLLGVTSAVCLLSYMLYTTSPETARLHGTNALVYTVPFVAYGIFRYLFKVQEGKQDGPVDVLLKDPVFAVNGLLWMVSVVAVLYLRDLV